MVFFYFFLVFSNHNVSMLVVTVEMRKAQLLFGHLGHVYGDGSLEGLPMLCCVFDSMGRWEPSIHPCAFNQRFSCTGVLECVTAVIYTSPLGLGRYLF